MVRLHRNMDTEALSFFLRYFIKYKSLSIYAQWAELGNFMPQPCTFSTRKMQAIHVYIHLKNSHKHTTFTAHLQQFQRRGKLSFRTYRLKMLKFSLMVILDRTVIMENVSWTMSKNARTRGKVWEATPGKLSKWLRAFTTTVWYCLVSTLLIVLKDYKR